MGRVEIGSGCIARVTQYINPNSMYVAVTTAHVRAHVRAAVWVLLPTLACRLAV